MMHRSTTTPEVNRSEQSVDALLGPSTENGARQVEVVPADLPVCYLMPAASGSVIKDSRQRKGKSGKNSNLILTRRQRRGLQLVAEGKSVKEISRILGVSAQTTEACQSQMMAALGIKDRAGLKRYALQIGIVRSGS
jgi:DNA-binding NarL/FixJ family response regulator